MLLTRAIVSQSSGQFFYSALTTLAAKSIYPENSKVHHVLDLHWKCYGKLQQFLLQKFNIWKLLKAIIKENSNYHGIIACKSLPSSNDDLRRSETSYLNKFTNKVHHLDIFMHFDSPLMVLVLWWQSRSLFS
jgi:hypothetical protein